jgi:tyrosyl-tRNA synthetase
LIINTKYFYSPKCSPDLESSLSKDKFGVYLGVDPTATSLHVGNLVALTTLLRFQQYGHPIVSLIGGATGYIGDPSGRSTERTLLTKEQLDANFKGIETQLTNFFDRAIKYIPNSSNEPQLKTVTLLNNYDWYKNMNIVEFLTKVGKWARVSTMLSRSRYEPIYIF